MKLDYTQLLETNNLLQINGDETYWLCVTRTVQESKLFPVPAYMLLSYLNAFYRYPALLRKIEQNMSAEELGDRARHMAAKAHGLSMWGLPCFYLLGREWLINMGLIRPQDAAEDVAYVCDFWKRFELSWRRNSGHKTAFEAGHRSQIHPEAQLQVFHADLYDCEVGDPLHLAAQSFVASASQYAFLIACESRISLHNHGPYSLGDDRQMIVRDFLDIGEYDFPWLDDVAKDLPYSSITVTMATKGVNFNIMDDWGSFESEPEFKDEHIVGVGLYTSDPLSDGYTPIGMESREELTRTFTDLNEKVKQAMSALWMRIAGWSRDQMMDAGALTYYAIIKDLAHIAGCYEPDDWIKIDERAERFRPLLNDEYSRDLLGEICVGSGPLHQINEYMLMQHVDLPRRIYTPIPYSILEEDVDYAPTVGGVMPGITYLDEKKDRYCTSQGVLGFKEYNERVNASDYALDRDAARHFCETTVKYRADTDEADQLYKIYQRKSRNLKDKGAGLRHSDIEAIRDTAEHR
jgi:hypothetical protein